MVFSIGIISAKSSLSHIQSSLSSRDSATYQFHYFPYSSVDEVPQIYKEHEHDCDGFVFSGALPYYQLLRHYSKLRVPCTYIDVTQRDYYCTLLQVTYQNPHLDIRRIWLDRPAVDIPWEYIFGTPDARPQMLPEVSIEPLFQPGIYQDIFQQYRDIIQNHQADFIITRVTNLNEQLKAANIPFALLLPSPSGIWETVEKLIHLIQSQQMADNLSAVGRVAGGTASRQVPDFQEWIAQFNRELGGGLILRNYANSTEILTSNSTLHRLTRNGSRFQLTDYLRQNCTTSFSLGWGVGLNVLQAQQNANRAINESLRDPNHGTYLIDENDRLTGPLGAEGCRTFSTPVQPGSTAAGPARRAIPHQRRASAGGQPQSAEHARHPERSFALPEHHAPHSQPHSQPVDRAGGRRGGGHRTGQFGRPTVLSAPTGWSCKSCLPRKPELRQKLYLFRGS